ncbi:MAG: ABC transporter permease [Streptomycetaceae bacterium]|nr:MAG: ABC transporter permease [Streptomycetaceae bacterium]
MTLDLSLPTAHDDSKAPGKTSKWLAAVPLAFLSFTVGIPLIIIFVYSFLARPSMGVGVIWKLDLTHYVKIFVQDKLDGTRSFDTRYLKVIWNSFFYSGLTTVGTMVLAIPVALWIATRDPRKRILLVFLVTLPFWTSILIRTYAIRQLLDEKGVLGKIATTLGFSDNFQILYTPTSTIIGLVYTFLPFMILPIYASAERFDFRFAEAGFDLGARKMTVLFRIVLPQIAPGIIAGIALVFIPGLGSFLQPDMLGGGKTNMIANVVANNYGQARNWPFGSALSVLLCLITLLATLMISLAARKRKEAKV